MDDKHIIIVTGLSGSGVTTALNILQDMGYYRIDNLPFGFEKHLNEFNMQKIVLGFNIRTFLNISDFYNFINSLNDMKIKYSILFLKASESVILSRYALTRRVHPVKEDTLLKSIDKEREFMYEISEYAAGIIDTTYIKPRELEHKMLEILKIDENLNEMNIHLKSFGFKYGIPIDLDLLFDVRFLPNPYYVADLKEKTGEDPEVMDYVMSSPISQEFYKRLLDLLYFLIPKYIEEGKKHLSIGVGCSGGKHRSVTFINLLKKDLTNMKQVNIYVSHREKELGKW